MFNILIISVILNICSVNANTQDFSEDNVNRSQPIGNIIAFRGDDVSIYSGGRKTSLEEKKMPYALYAGDEIGTSPLSDCEMLLNTSETVYLSSDTLISMDTLSKGTTKMYVKYGMMMFRGSNPIQLQTRDFSGETLGGDFILKYKRSSFETTVYNFGSKIKVKRDIDDAYMILQSKKYIRLSSFKGGIKGGAIKEESIPVIYNTFRISFKPEGSTAIQNSIPGATDEIRPLPYTKAANLDTIKRVIGL